MSNNTAVLCTKGDYYKMRTLWKKLFSKQNKTTPAHTPRRVLSADESAVLSTIAQNAQSIKYEFRQAGGYEFYIFCIIQPTIKLCAVREITPNTPNGTITYHMEQRTNDGDLVAVKDEKASDFAHLVYSKLFDSFVNQRNGINTTADKQR